ncbi:MAG: DUF2971 domain-containing protein [Candidatus Omnitrophica bacterium]|nr:DUF2971 domain-containing protein [Candidatus Omnitrophota bacterium]MDD5690181.1 DUF2971 domain-containing protein [Candidatus Omnitrophota bacterium]
MNILYKYCDCLGSIKILASLELKLPFASDINDPYDVRPYYYCGQEEDKIVKRVRLALQRNNFQMPDDSDQAILDIYKEKSMGDSIIDTAKKFQADSNKKSGLLSVSKNSRNTVMWAHYADKHQGIVIGIDFESLFLENDKVWGIKMYPVEYSSERLRVDVLDEYEKYAEKVLFTKSDNWKYENEFRAFFAEKLENGGLDLESLKFRRLALFKDFCGKKTWFLRLNPQSIRKVIFGIYTDESLKLAIKKLAFDLPNVKLYQACESETYELNLTEI